jgi:thiol:disulfide interchange protein DsbD
MSGGAGLRLSLVAGVALALAPPAAGQPTASGGSRNVVATLVSETESFRPGASLWVGLHLQMAPDWHTYWRNPGDSGLPTRIQWRLPDAFTAGPLLWPGPERMYVNPLMSYGYSGEVLLLTELRVPASLSAPGPVALGAKVDWLECKEVCLPGKAELQIALPVADGEPRKLAEWAGRFDAARRRLPAPPVGLELQASRGRDALRLAVRGGGKPREAYFFPAAAEAIEQAAPQPVRAIAGGYELALQRPAGAKPIERLEGVLVADGRVLEVGLPIVEGAAEADAAPVDAAPGLLAALAFAFVGGIILNLMPCVLPVLSLKVLSFVRHGAGPGGGALRHGLAFTAGVLAFFWILAGALVALRAGGEQIGWGFQLQSPAFVVFLSALFLLLSLNLLGVFEVGESLTTVGALEGRASGLAGSFWSGGLATLVATPCTAPFMGSALGFALGQTTAVTLAVFTALGLGMASPYLLLSASPRLLRFVPRPGAWMETFKQLMGFVLLATVVFLLWLFGRQVGINGMSGLMLGLLLLGMAAWLYGRETRPEGPGARRLALGAAAAIGLAGLAVGFSQAQGAPAGSAAARKPAHDAGWEAYSEERLAELRAKGTPVLVDFTADWCLTCQVNERVALGRPEVRERFQQEGVVLMKADWTLRDERITRALAAHGRQGVPVYALYGRDPKASARLLPEVLSPGIVLRALDETLGKKEEARR